MPAECVCSDVLGDDVCDVVKYSSVLLPIRIAIDLPAVLSVWVLVITVVLLGASPKKFLTCMASVAPVSAETDVYCCSCHLYHEA